MIHLAVAYVLSKKLKIPYLQLALVGALIPDINLLGTIFSRFFLKTNKFTTIKYFSAFHTPIMLLAIALVISLLFKETDKAFIAINIGIISHLLLDLLEKGGGLILLYPLKFKVHSYGLFWANGIAGYFLSFISFIILFHAIIKRETENQNIRTKFEFKRKKVMMILFVFKIGRASCRERV